jgi:hypothetical protein
LSAAYVSCVDLVAPALQDKIESGLIFQYARHLVPLASVVNDKTFGSFEGAREGLEGRAEEMVKGVWREVSGS